ncbi:MAG TPA: galactokinase [Spirochaetota bacterium]|mgnify:CR=1 FL=1|nr:galactokinase [Spirochaetota bacterium]HPL16728.1 galactokinase [Spirochaetota bacterium]HQF07304.1 galactokinase [Spirochaetota bacterium]HQH96205.1 galactokinase [Spirochaetota bacterium]HQJ69380.1 galactokinase [Spirochaetota bacterium]
MPNLKHSDGRKNSFFTDTAPVRTFFAPGRINLIGEHLDYNGGYVFPAAISLGITGRLQLRDDALVRIKSEQAPGEVTADLEGNAASGNVPAWAHYPLGALRYVRKSGVALSRGMNILYSSTLPQGSGLSSSAALEVLTAYMLTGASIWSEQDRLRIAVLMKDMENEHIGVQCGIMDQFTVALGKKGHAILLNSDTLAYSYVPVDTGASSFIIMNSNRPRALADSKYNERRTQCEKALALIREHKPQYRHLAEAAINDLESIRDHVLAKRARHVITENKRVLESAEALQAGDLRRFGALLTDSHGSLRDDYEVTGPELDALADAAVKAPGCAGARMTGAGFGGCAVALVENSHIAEFKAVVSDSYRNATGLTVDFYRSILEDGVREMMVPQKAHHNH